MFGVNSQQSTIEQRFPSVVLKIEALTLDVGGVRTIHKKTQTKSRRAIFCVRICKIIVPNNLDCPAHRGTGIVCTPVFVQTAIFKYHTR